MLQYTIRPPGARPGGERHHRGHRYPDTPWTDMALSPTSTPVMLAGQGVYVNANTATGYIEVGLKTN